MAGRILEHLKNLGCGVVWSGNYEQYSVSISLLSPCLCQRVGLELFCGSSGYPNYFLCDGCTWQPLHHLPSLDNFNCFPALPFLLGTGLCSRLCFCLEWWSFELVILLAGKLPNPQLETSVLSILLPEPVTDNLVEQQSFDLITAAQRLLPPFGVSSHWLPGNMHQAPKLSACTVVVDISNDAKDLIDKEVSAFYRSPDNSLYMLPSTPQDTCNRKSNQQNLGTIKSSNLCTEIIEYTSPTETAVLLFVSLVFFNSCYFIFNA